ncbi:MAG: hypothetical protein ACRYGR_02995 [Janthinobacterium lividum]
MVQESDFAKEQPETLGGQGQSEGEGAASKGYYDAETPEKCKEVTKLHGEFYQDLTARHTKAKEDFQAYSTRLKELISNQQAKVSHHSGKLNVGWSTVSKS